ncbi:MAG: EVE domain-containing protein [Planctomycetia bacterium]|nr:EVE domain-containing protein [Planctomycetia bacterium]
MNRWLFKEEPESYSYDRLENDKQAKWDGISNALALKNLRQVKRGDQIFFYHTGKEKAIVGIMQAVADAHVKASVSVQVAPVRRLVQPVSLATVKADPVLKDWELARLPRLSIMPVSANQWRRVLALAKK